MKTVLRTALAFGVAFGAAACSSSSPATPAPAATGASDLVATEVHPLPGTDSAPFDKERKLSAPKGWTVSVWARVRGARLLAWTPDGRLLVSRPGAGDVLALTPQGDGAPAKTTVADGLNQPHGLAFRGNTLYVAESDQVDSFRYASGAVTGKKVVVSGLPDAKSAELGGAYAHALKSVAVGKGGELYISVGSTGNVSPEDRDADPERAAILRAPAGGGKPTVFARGVRNGTGLAIDPEGGVWTAVNNRDNIAYPNDDDYTGDGKSDQGEVLQAYVNDHPLEPLARLTEGRDLGWPYCNPDRPGAPFLRDYENNADGSKLDCASLKPVEQGMGAHSAPLGLSFATALPEAYGKGALVGIHGSWNRKPPRPPEVSFFQWREGTLGPQQTLLTGFQNADGSRWGRPVMAVQGPDKALYVSDDFAGAIYRVVLG
jgi:glucose/arabinose dehydrogenase